MNENQTTTTVPNLTSLQTAMTSLRAARAAQVATAQAALTRATQDLEMAQDGAKDLMRLTDCISAVSEGRASKLELIAAHGLVANKADHRGPIDAVIAPSLKRIVGEAIRFFDATPARFGATTSATGEEALRVTAKGYRAGPAGDH